MIFLDDSPLECSEVMENCPQALAIPLPVPGGRQPVTLLDVGANAEVRPEHLVQFAFMGAALASTVLGIQRPRVALLYNGTEAIKGVLMRLPPDTPGVVIAQHIPKAFSGPFAKPLAHAP